MRGETVRSPRREAPPLNRGGERLGAVTAFSHSGIGAFISTYVSAPMRGMGVKSCNQNVIRLSLMVMSIIKNRLNRETPGAVCGALLLLCVVFGSPIVQGAETKGNAGEGTKTADIFRFTNTWTVHLKFTPEQWTAMEPPQSERGPFGEFGGGPGPAGGRPFGGPGGPQGRGPGGPVGFGPSMILAPTFLKQGDQNHDGKLSNEEFHALAMKWFADWDKEKSGQLNADRVGSGLNTALVLPDFARPGPGGPGGRGPGLFLQGPAGKRNGLAAAAGIDFPYVHADLEFSGRLFKDVAVRYKGNGTFMQSRGSLKRSLKVDLNEFVKGQKLAGISKLNLHNNVTDASWMNEVMSHRLFRDAGMPASQTAYARVYITVPGRYDKQYFGLYSLVENVDSNFTEARFGTRKGAIFKPVTRDLFAYLGDDWAQYQQTYDAKTDPTPDERRRVIEFAKLVTNGTDADFEAKLDDFLDLDEFARFMAVTVWLSTMDSILGPGQNYYVYLHPKTHKFQFMPWDLDHSFGQFGMMGAQNQRENLSIHQPWQGENRFLERVFKAPAFKKLYLAKLDEFNKTIFKPERFYQQVDEIAAAIRPAVQEESEVSLARFDQVVSGKSVEPAGFGGFPRGGAPDGGSRGEGPRFGGPGGFFPAAKPIKGFVAARAQSVIDQVAGKSRGETVGGFGFGGGGGRGGRGGPGGMAPGNFLANLFVTALDANKDGSLQRSEFEHGFGKWFEAWNTDKSGTLTEEQLRAGIDRDLSPFRGGPGGFGFGSPNGPPPREP